MNQEWGICEKNLQRLKGIINLNSPRKKISFLINQIRGASIEE
jgi:hypothetical protein